MRRRIVSVATPAAIVASAAMILTGLTGCSAATHTVPETGVVSNGCSNLLRPGALSNGVRIDSSGVDVVGPTDIVNAQRSVVEPGGAGGHIAQPGDIVNANVTTYDAVTGEQLDERSAAPHLALPESAIADTREALHSADSDSLNFDYLIATALVCTTPGDTLVVALTPMQSMASQLSMNATVAVVDVLEAFPAKARGALRGLPNGFPAVTTDETGRPGIVLPPQQAPSKQQAAVRIVGEGDDVTADDSVIGQVLTVSWDGSVVANTWVDGMVGFGTEEGPNPAYSFREALTGFPVGSQVVILDPNDGSPVVHVVDIIAVA